MNNLVEVTGLANLLEARGIHPDIENFESFYSDLASTAANEPLILEIQEKIRSYFSSLQIPENPTIYDYLLLTLREKDVIATFNWDPLLAQAHERNINIGSIPEIFYLHGNVGIGICLEHHMRGFIWQDCMKCARPLTPMELLFPVMDKNYTDDPFIAHQWQQLELYLQNAYWITIFGYSAPMTDVAARDLMLQVWRTNLVRDFAQIEIVDIKTKSELRKTWSDLLSGKITVHMEAHSKRICSVTREEVVMRSRELHFNKGLGKRTKFPNSENLLNSKLGFHR